MPIGWVDKHSNIYHLSPIYCKFEIREASRRQSAVNRFIPEDALFKSFKDAVTSPQFILFCLWASLSDMNIVFSAFTWGQYTRNVDPFGYQSLVEWYGNLGWTSACFKLLIGFMIDAGSVKFKKLGFTLTIGKLIATLFFIGFGCIIAVVMNGLQLLGTVEGAIGIILMLNVFQSCVYPMLAMFIKTAFPIGFFGRLIGIVNVTMGLTSSLVIGLSEVPKRFSDYGFDGIFSAFLVAMLLITSFPISCLHRITNNRISPIQKFGNNEKMDED